MNNVTGPSIAAVIPLYNHAAYIESALRSVLEQSSPASEILLIDDGSTDGGIAVAERVLKGQPHARVFRQHNVGAHVTINRLVAAAQSEWIAILNSDDRFLPEKLQRVRQMMNEHRDADLFFGRVNLVDDNERPITSGETIEWLERAETFRRTCGRLDLALLNENFAATTSNFVFRKSAWLRLGGFANLRYCHDLDFVLTLAKQGRVVFDCDTAHIAYRVHPGNTIKERLDHVRLEVAATLACAIFDGCGVGASEAAEPIAWSTLLAAKHMSAQIVYLIALRAALTDRHALYGRLADPAIRKQILSAMPIS